MSTENALSGFEALGLPSSVLATLASLDYLQPSPIQAQMIPLMLSGRDVIGQAQTGTGKTAAFALPLIARYAGINASHVQVLVLAPVMRQAIRRCVLSVYVAAWIIGRKPRRCVMAFSS